MTPKLEFCSAAWIDAVRRIIEDELDTAPLADVEYSESEEFTDPPEHLSRAGTATIGFSVVIARGDVQVLDRPSPEVSFHVVGDYALMAQVARTPFGDGGIPTHVAELMQRAVAAGAVRLAGDRGARPEALDRLCLHDRMAAVTS